MTRTFTCGNAQKSAISAMKRELRQLKKENASYFKKLLDRARSGDVEFLNRITELIAETELKLNMPKS